MVTNMRLFTTRDRQPPIEWGPIERTARAALFATVMSFMAVITTARTDNAGANRVAMACLVLAVTTYLVTATIGTIRYEKRRRALRP